MAGRVGWMTKRKVSAGTAASGVPAGLRHGRERMVDILGPSLSLSGTLRPAKFSALLVALLAACSPKTYALRNVADALSSSGQSSVFARDDDPELVREAV